MPYKPLRDLTPTEATSHLHAEQLPEASSNDLFYRGDHWQNGGGWVGPIPDPRETGAAVVVAQIRRGFVSRNVVAEVSDRHSNALVGREPKWGFTVRRGLDENEKPSAEEQGRIDTVEAWLTEWWDKRHVPETILELVATMLHQGRSVLRLFIPPGRLTRRQETQEPAEGTVGEAQKVTTTVAQAPDIAKALDMIYLDTPHPKDAAVLEDPESMENVGVFHYHDNDVDYVDIMFAERDAELELGVTVHRRSRQGTSGVEEWKYPLGGRLLLGQIERPLMVNTQVQQNQRALNLALSMLPRNVVTGGFLERIMRGAQMPGQYVDDASVVGGKRWVPGDYVTGPGTTQWLQPIVVTDAQGKQHLSNPDVTFREPIDPEPTIRAVRAHYEAILNEVEQLHHLISGDADTSAISRVEARVDFLHSLRRSQAPVERLGRWLLETVLALAEAIVGGDSVGLYTDELRAEFNCRLQLGHLTSEEQTVLMELVKNGLVTREDAMALLGVDDVDAAIAKINAQPGSMLEMRKLQAETLSAWVLAGVTIDVAAKLIGLSKEDIQLIQSMPAPEDPGQGDAGERQE